MKAGNAEFITYCGLYCGLCAQRVRIPDRAGELKEVMEKEGYLVWGQELPGFSEFWQFLTDLCDQSKACPGCRQGGGPDFCTIRKCAVERGVFSCVECPDAPCHRIRSLAAGYPTLLADTSRLQAIGQERWVEEQVERAMTGFTYSDIRCHPYKVPAE